MQLINNFIQRFRFLLCVTDISSKYAGVAPLKDKKAVTVTNAFQKILNDSARKPNKVCVDKGRKVYNNFLKKWLEGNSIEMYTTHSECKSVVAKRFLKTLKTKIYKYMTTISKNVYIDKLEDIVNEYINTDHRAIKMKPVDVKDNTNIGFKKEVNDKDSKSKVGDHVRISKCKKYFW